MKYHRKCIFLSVSEKSKNCWVFISLPSITHQHNVTPPRLRYRGIVTLKCINIAGKVAGLHIGTGVTNIQAPLCVFIQHVCSLLLKDDNYAVELRSKEAHVPSDC